MLRWQWVVGLVLLTSCTGSSNPAPCPERPPPPAPVATPSATQVEVRRDGFIVDDRWPSSLDATAFARLRKRAEEERSTALILVHDGRLVHASNPSGEGELDQASLAMSVSKSVVALLVGRLVDGGALKLDAPLSQSLVPEWKDDDRANVTLRHLLNHTSGLDPVRSRAMAYEGNEKVRENSIEKTGLGAKLITPVGSKFAYNNQAVDFISVLIKRLYPDGVRLDDLMQKLVFGPLNVRGAFWSKDDHGDPGGSGELVVRPIDLAKIGQLILDRGQWQGERILSASWMDEMLAAGQPHYDGCGLLWWRDGRRQKGTPIELLSYRADGYLGQYIVVVPDRRLVAVRMRDPNRTSWKPEEFSYKDFFRDVLAVAGHDLPAQP